MTTSVRHDRNDVNLFSVRRIIYSILCWLPFIVWLMSLRMSYTERIYVPNSEVGNCLFFLFRQVDLFMNLDGILLKLACLSYMNWSWILIMPWVSFSSRSFSSSCSCFATVLWNTFFLKYIYTFQWLCLKWKLDKYLVL